MSWRTALGLTSVLCMWFCFDTIAQDVLSVQKGQTLDFYPSQLSVQYHIRYKSFLDQTKLLKM